MDVSDIPWGLKPVAGIPVPPFRTWADVIKFKSALSLWMAEIARAQGGPSPFAVAAALILARDPPSYGLHSRGPEPTEPVWPTPLVMTLACQCDFPAPWTPDLLVATLRAVSAVDRQFGLWWQDDPNRIRSGDIYATRCDGSWTVGISDRGYHIVATPPDDWAMCLFLMDLVAHQFPFPYAHAIDGVYAGWQAELASQAPVYAAQWQIQAGYPYLRDNWS
jgi:hypothetical protein